MYHQTTKAYETLTQGLIHPLLLHAHRAYESALTILSARHLVSLRPDLHRQIFSSHETRHRAIAGSRAITSCKFHLLDITGGIQAQAARFKLYYLDYYLIQSCGTQQLRPLISMRSLKAAVGCQMNSALYVATSILTRIADMTADVPDLSCKRTLRSDALAQPVLEVFDAAVAADSLP
jgi:hypothetical protein